ncbi:sodium-translocating pyrophosphatase [Candidatus Microgenomates bacterium]|nr:sodium-translocating pyrophosphatase [Candidatus Microgenomates bacterium]
MSETQTVWLALLAAAAAVGYAAYNMRWVLSRHSGSDNMMEVSRSIQEGAKAYLNRQYRVVGMIGLFLVVILAGTLGTTTAIGFVIGALLSAVCGYLGMFVAVRANVRTAEAAKKGLNPALKVAFSAAVVTGLLVTGLGLAAVAGFWLIFENVKALIGLGFGASLISVFARLGGGIYTKAADVGADLVGKIEAGIPEDDPRNPATIADNVGDNVGDVAGMAADLFETYAISLVAAIILGSLVFPGFSEALVYPLALGAVAIIGAIIGVQFVKVGSSGKIMPAMYKGLGISAVVTAILFYPVTNWLMGDNQLFSVGELFGASLIGIALTAGMMLVTEYFTSTAFRPVRHIADASQTGHATNIIAGLAIGMKATALPIIMIVISVLGAFSLAGVYGVAIAGVAMLSMAGVVVAVDSFGAIADNAGGIAEMSSLPAKVRKVTDALDAVGNTTKAVTKGYAIASAGLAAVVLFSAFSQEVAEIGNAVLFQLSDPYILAGLLIGGLLPFYFAALSMEAVGQAAGAVVNEVRRQFKEIKGIMAGKTKPLYGRAVDIVTTAALKAMLVPALLPVLMPIFLVLIGNTMGEGRAALLLGGALVGSIVTGVFVAISMTSGGAAWDNAKKYIEAGQHGGKGSSAHAAAVTGDTVGDPYKDTAGPAINPMIKILNIVALLLVSYLA